MAKKHYKYNPDTLLYEENEVSLISRIKKSTLAFLGLSVIAVTWIFVYSLFFKTPKEIHLLKTTNDLLVSYEIMSMKLAEAECTLNEIIERDNSVYRAVFEEDTIPYTVRNAGFGGVDMYAKYENLGIENSNILINIYRRMDILQKKAYIQSKSFDRISELASSKLLIQQSMPIFAPVDLSSHIRLSSVFGYRTDPVYGGRQYHKGVDLSGNTGMPIFASGDGVVSIASYNGGGYGNMVEVDHGFGYTTRYAHLRRINVVKGKKVKRGEKIGEMGSTGKSIGPHLHYEVRLKGNPQNPLLYFENQFNAEDFEFVDQGDDEFFYE
ncbi:MAG: M23 family metallopeptidase [Prevotellaceae bacterium]|nr:M23 family metallopeptidase [Prevotellaceae bacterium]